MLFVPATLQMMDELDVCMPKPARDSRFGINLTDKDRGGSNTVYVESLNPSGVAASAGLVVGDIIVSINGATPLNPAIATQMVTSAPVGEVLVKIRRAATDPLPTAPQHVEMAIMQPQMQMVQAQPPVAQPQPATAIAQPAGQDKVTKLKELKELLDSGALTQEEFDVEKKSILAEPETPTHPATGVPPQMKGRFDAETGKENPKFDPETGVQNW